MTTAWVLFVFGTLISLGNFYTSCLRYPIFRMRGGDRADYRWVSGIPLLGSAALFIAALLFGYAGLTAACWLALLIAVFDTAGLHWFAVVMLYAMMRSPIKRGD